MTGTEGGGPPPGGRTPREIAAGYRDAQVIRVAVELGLAEMLATGPRHCRDLAATVGADEPSLCRLLRALAALGVLGEQEDGRFALTEAGGTLREGVPGSVRDFVRFMTGDWYWRAWGSLRSAVETGESAFERVNGMSNFEYWERHPEAGAIHDAAFTAMTSEIAASVARVYDFSRFATLVDVGGSRGTLLAAILAAYPRLQGVLFDLPHVVAGAGAVLEPAGVAERCRVVGGDFFVSVPARGDGYILKQVIHDWDDARAVAILSRCREAMTDGGRVLLVETVMPERMQPSPTGRWQAMLDLMMLVTTPGGRERTEGQFRDLLARAGLTLVAVTPATPQYAIVEAAAA